ncbi:hypothetical protein TNCV_4307561 [Trichonephila clavipes]|nr:hypothetical protein TNCV_4307561 [Trichonephila clavipes]
MNPDRSLECILGISRNIPCIKAEFIASWGCSQSSVVSRLSPSEPPVKRIYPRIRTVKKKIVGRREDKNADRARSKPAVVTPSLQQWKKPIDLPRSAWEDPLKWLKRVRSSSQL